jgi:hypothetical protein
MPPPPGSGALPPPPGFRGGPGQPPLPPAPPAGGGGDGGSFWSRKVAKLPVAAWIGVAVVAAAAIGGAVLVGGGDDDGPGRLAIDPDAVTTATVAPAPTTVAVPGTTAAAPETTRPDTAPDDTTPDTTEPEQPEIGDGSSPDSPFALGETVSYNDGFSADEWDVRIDGLVEVPLYWDDDEGERCFVVVGTLTPTTTDKFVADAFGTPPITLFLDDAAAELGSLSCAVEDIAEMGYRSPYEANVTAGTEVAFYQEFSLPEDAGDPQAIAVATDFEEFVFFDATPLPEVPEFEIGAVGPLTAEVAPLAEGSPASFEFTYESSGDTWSGTIAGLVEVPTDEGLAGRCFAVLGTLTPGTIAEGIVSSPYTAPPLALMADGRLVDDYYGCTDDVPAEAGYRWWNELEVTAGTSKAVFATLIVPEPFPAELQAIVVGESWAETPAHLYQPLVLGSVPPVTPTPGVAAGVATTPVGTPVTYTSDWDEATWNVAVHGLLATAARFPDDSPGRCVLALADATLTAGDDEHTPPELFLIVDGQLIGEDFECDDTPAADAGYVSTYQPSLRQGGTASVYAAFRIPPDVTVEPEAIVVGRSGDGAQQYVAPTVIAQAPPAAPTG